MLFLTDKGYEQRYFFIIPVKYSTALPNFESWLNQQGYAKTEDKNKENLKWLRNYSRETYRAYMFYHIAKDMTVVSEIIQQKELRNVIDLFFDKDAKEISQVIDSKIFYIANEHSMELFAVFRNGNKIRKLEMHTHSPNIQLEEAGRIVSLDEIKKRDYFSSKDYIRSLDCPIEIHKQSIKRIVKKAVKKELFLFCKQHNKTMDRI
ncbi:MAG: hypothetical protein ABH952_09475 [Candidatus Omnitrophota bacterium]